MKFFKTILILCSIAPFFMTIAGPNYGDLRAKQRSLNHVDVFAFFQPIDSTGQHSSNSTPITSRNSSDEEAFLPFSSSFIEETERFNKAYKQHKSHKNSSAITSECTASEAHEGNTFNNEPIEKTDKNKLNYHLTMMFLNKKNHSESPFEQWNKRGTPSIIITPPCDDIPCDEESKNEDTFFLFE